MKTVNRIWLFLALITLVSCSGPGVQRDSGPARDIDVSLIPDAVPRVEPLSKWGNRSPYDVFGRTYHVLPSSRGYRERGVASWYGTKFHGRKTSNGETYDMYAMTAAHKSLPIPSYVQVTNLENGKRIIVRVNDRGPFHDDRVIDLSYVAAKKLGMHDTGTSRVEVVAIDPARFQHNTVEAPRIPSNPQPLGVLAGQSYLQTGAFSSRDAAQSSRAQIAELLKYPVLVREAAVGGKTLFKVLVGPIDGPGELSALRDHLMEKADLAAFVVRY
ncbi:MAG: septal ring lytic transglycosylase RlpA family lipoprotein [Porticoccaceae bacterium]|nr:septal ring lytic transglycosylase RlpA family lipoprotein [Porticoccaceae bacterium]